MAVAVCALAGAGSAQAATFTVNTTTDGTVAGGCTIDPTCSLRDAVDAADNSADADNTVTVPAGVYELTLDEIEAFGNDISIVGAGARTTTIDAGGQSRAFDFSGGAITLRGLTITGGVSPTAIGASFPGDGGAILAINQTLELDGVALVDNEATLNGGGLAAPPESGGPAGPASTPITITNSTISGNRVTGGAVEGQGGGVYVTGDTTILNSTISGNSVTNPGANAGGGLAAIKDPNEVDTTTVSLTSTTIAGNSTSGGLGASFGGGYAGEDPVGAGLTTLEATNSIIAGNTVEGGTEDCGFTAQAITSNHNLSSDASCGFTDAGSLQNTDPKLGPLADNGGPTDTRALLSGSPAIDAGVDPGCPGADQRGISRPQGFACDIGAFELVPSADLAVSLTGAPESVTVGDTVTYTLTVVNNGPQKARGVTASDLLPAGLAVRSVSSEPGVSCIGEPLVCSMPDLAPGQSVVVTIVASTAATGSLTSNASVTGRFADPVVANNIASVTTTVRPVPSANLSVRQKVSRKSVKVGSSVVFTITVSNSGPNTATGVRLRDTLSANLGLASRLRVARRCSGGRSLNCTLANIASGKSVKVRLVASARRRGLGRNVVSVSGSRRDPRAGNNRSVATVRVRPRRSSSPAFTG
jgi:uncharacterized repeat protein (TIGR01451 family)